MAGEACQSAVFVRPTVTDAGSVQYVLDLTPCKCLMSTQRPLQRLYIDERWQVRRNTKIFVGINDTYNVEDDLERIWN